MNMETDIKTIRKAICANRGGHENTDDSGIVRLWNSLPKETQEEYLATVEVKAENAPVLSTGAKRKTKTEN